MTCEQNATLFVFVPAEDDVWPWTSNTDNIFVQCT